MPFIIFGGLHQHDAASKMSPRSFLWRRITRIWPMYAITIASIVVCSLVVSSGFISNPTTDLNYFFNIYRADPTWIMQTLSFTHWTRPPLLTIGWTLQLEFIFYVSIAVVLLFGAKTFTRMVVGLFIIFAIATCLSGVSKAASVVASPIIFEFFLGIFLYKITSMNILLPTRTAITTALACVPLFFLIDGLGLASPGTYLRPITWGVPAFLLVWSMLSLEKNLPKYKLMLLLGDSSYSLYLIHGILSPWFAYLWLYYDLLSMPAWFYLVIYLICCQTAGIAAHLYLEKPINTFIRNRSQGRNTCAAA